jgi:hypothetical protein
MSEHRATIILVASIVLVLGFITGWAFISSGKQEVSSAPLTEISDAAAIQSSLQLSHLSIATSENFARQKIYVISAYLKTLPTSASRGRSKNDFHRLRWQADSRLHTKGSR